MAKALQAGERVLVKRSFRIKSDSLAYQQGLKSVSTSLTGEVVGPAPEGRALLVNFNGVQVPVTTQNLQRAEETAKKARGNRHETPHQILQDTAVAEPQQSTQEAASKKPRGRHVKAEQSSTSVQHVAKAQEKATQPSVPEQPAPKRRGRRPGSVQPIVGQDSGESGLQLLTLIANKMLLRGTIKIQSEATVEVALSDLPTPVQQQLQRLIDAKLSLDLKSLGK